MRRHRDAIRQPAALRLAICVLSLAVIPPRPGHVFYRCRVTGEYLADCCRRLEMTESFSDGDACCAAGAARPSPEGAGRIPDARVPDGRDRVGIGLVDSGCGCCDIAFRDPAPAVPTWRNDDDERRRSRNGPVAVTGSTPDPEPGFPSSGGPGPPLRAGEAVAAGSRPLYILHSALLL